MQKLLAVTLVSSFICGSLIADTISTSITTLKRNLYFGITSNSTGFDSLWSSKGSSDDTEEVSPLGGNTNFATDMTEYKRKLYFIATTTTTNDDGTTTATDALWVSDGTDNGTKNIISFDDGVATVTDLVQSSRKLYFFLRTTTANDDGTTTTSDALWVSDGTNTGTEEIVTLTDNAKVVGNISLNKRKLYFNVRTITTNDDGSTTNDDALWVTDGKTNGTTEEIFPFTAND